MDTSAFLSHVALQLQADFDANKRVMSFSEYLSLFQEFPRQQTRNAARYVFDCLQHYGTSQVSTTNGSMTRWTLFDAPWDDGRDRVVGQEGVQMALVRAVENLVRQRRVNKLILLHGPNGSAKSSILGCLARGIEAYSRLDIGAMYRFNWVFPSLKVSRKLGFGGQPDGDPLDTFAYLDDEKIDAQISGELSDHPLLLLPVKFRHELIHTALEAAGSSVDDALVSQALLEGELSPRNQVVAEKLFASYKGDLNKLLRHVQVERFFVSRRFRRAAVTVEPQTHVDAGVRQLTGDRSLSSLPAVLQSATLYEAFGDLVDANRGILEFNDLFKRPPETYKYLLATSEKSTVTLPNQILHLDVLMVASSNETYLEAYKAQSPDWPSLKGRLDLVRVPYLLDYTTEQLIYDDQVSRESLSKAVAPHATYVAALWAVLTRLRKPQTDLYPKELRGTIASLTPMQKAELYATGRAPHGLALEKVRALRSLLPDLWTESRADGYEGKVGASPREIKTVILNAAQRTDYAVVTPMAILDEITDLCGQTTVHPFLQMEPEGSYLKPLKFVSDVRERWLDIAIDELTQAVGLVTRDQYDLLFQRYLRHVSHQQRGEKLENPITGQFESADEVFMAEMEAHFSIGDDAAGFRQTLLGRIGAASQNGPVRGDDYRDLFPDLFDKLEGSYYEAQRPTVRKTASDALTWLAGDDDQISEADRKRVRATLKHLEDEFGYCVESAKEMISLLLSERLSD